MSSRHFIWDSKKRTGFGCGATNRNSFGWLGPSTQQKTLAPWKKSYDKSRQHMKKQRHYFADKDQQSYGFSRSQVWMWELDHKGGWALWGFQTELMLSNCGAGEDSWESLGLQGDQTSQSKRKSILNIHWKDYAKAEAQMLWPPDVKNWLIGKDSDARKDWGQKEKRAAEDEMAGEHHQPKRH